MKTNRLIIISCLLFGIISVSHASAPAGDVAPYGNPDGQVNAADLVILQRFITGDLSPTPTEVLICDVAPLGAPDTLLNVADLLVLNRAILGLVNLPPVDLSLIDEGFESQAPGQPPAGGTNGFSWEAATGQGGGAVDVTGFNPVNGAQSLRFFFAGNSVNNGSGELPPTGGGTRAEQRFSFPVADLVRTKYQLAVPMNYQHRQTNGLNHQLLVFAEDAAALMGGHAYSALELTTGADVNSSDLELVYTRDGLAQSRLLLSTGFITIADHGSVMGLEIEVKLSSSMSVHDGHYRIWKNGVLHINLQNLDNYGGIGTLNNQMAWGYLMGWSASGYQTDTTFLIDDFELYTNAAAVIGTPGDTIPPSPITDFAVAEGISPNTQVMISFTPATDNNVIYRHDLRNASDGSLVQANITSGQVISGLTEDTNYNWFIRVMDTAGNTTDSNVFSYNTRQITENEAARFLAQSTFGTTFSDIAQVRSLGFDSWIDGQVNLPIVPQRVQVRNLADKMCVKYRSHDVRDSIEAEYPELTTNWPGDFIWWESAVEAQDQLRQRIALALSEIFVVNRSQSPLGQADYYDTLLRNAYGNYRVLLEEVTLHPIMGEYLTYIRNQKEDTELNIQPDENYAREVLQLFSIGVHQLDLNGTVKLDVNNNPVPTYNQNQIEAFARVFTGWRYYVGIEPIMVWRFLAGKDGVLGATYHPMEPEDYYHDTGPDSKQLLNYPNAVNEVLPAGQDTRMDLEQALDNIFHHPNVGPFIGKQLIQRLVTSNPSPAYVARVATAFNDNGSGIRGDLLAVVKAILLDPEARLAGSVTQPNFGKLREPLLRLTHLWRAFGVRNPTFTGGALVPAAVRIGLNCPLEAPHQVYNVFRIHSLIDRIGQNPLDSTTVFNFFFPDYVPQGPAGTAQLAAPEFQLTTVEHLTNMAGYINEQLRYHHSVAHNEYTYPNVDEERIWADDHDQLLDKLDTLFTSGTMSVGLRTILSNRLTQIDTSFQIQIGNGTATVDDMRSFKLRDTTMFLLNSRDYVIQK